MMTNKTFRIDSDVVEAIIDASYNERCSQGEVIARAMSIYKNVGGSMGKYGPKPKTKLADQSAYDDDQEIQ